MRSRSTRLVSAAGAALVELVIALPVMLLLVIGTADFARVFYLAIELTNAARAGAQYGGRSLGTGTDDVGMRSVAGAAINTTGITTLSSHVCQCALANGTFPDTVSCASDPATVCPSPKFRVITVTVTAWKTFTTISPYPGIPHTFSVTRAATMRVTE